MADLSVERAARALFVHPNTVRYRLRRLAKLTGLDVARFYDLVELLTAIRLLPAGQRSASDALTIWDLSPETIVPPEAA
jgi:DNA-binding PucR family transcriptional regulator